MKTNRVRPSATFAAKLIGAASLALGIVGAATPAAANAPKIERQRDYFSQMPRVDCVIRAIDSRARTMTVQVEKDSRLVTLPVPADTQLRFRDSWGALEDFFPGQHVTLLMLIGPDKEWLYPRAVSDDIHHQASHKRFATVSRIDRAQRIVSTRRQDVRRGLLEEQLTFVDDVKVWKGAAPAGIAALQVGDEVVHQLAARDGPPVVVQFLDRAGVAAVVAKQDRVHRTRQEQRGLEAYVNDIDPLSGLVTVTVPSGDEARASDLLPGVVAVSPEARPTFAASILASEPADKRRRFYLHVNARAAAGLRYGEPLRIWLPGTGPAVPEGQLGLPGPQEKEKKR